MCFFRGNDIHIVIEIKAGDFSRLFRTHAAARIPDFVQIHAHGKAERPGAQSGKKKDRQ